MAESTKFEANKFHRELRIDDLNKPKESPQESLPPFLNENNQQPVSAHSSYWDKATNGCVLGSNVCNVGIVLDVVSSYVRTVRGIPGLEFATVMAESAIYGFKSLYHLIFLAYAKFTKQEGEQQELGMEHRYYEHPYHMWGDVVCLTLFTVTIFSLLGILVANPVGATVGWFTGLTGVAVNVYFDYYYQAKMAKENKDELREALVSAKDEYVKNFAFITKAKAEFESLEALLKGLQGLEKNPSLILAPEERERIHAAYSKALELSKNYFTAKEQYLKGKDHYQELADATRLYTAVLVGLVFLLVCGTAATFAPPALVPILLGLKYTGIAMLITVNVSRFVNWAKPEWLRSLKEWCGIKDEDKELLKDPVIVDSKFVDESVAEGEDQPLLVKGEPVSSVGIGPTLFAQVVNSDSDSESSQVAAFAPA